MTYALVACLKMRKLFPFLNWFWLFVVAGIVLTLGTSYLQEGTFKIADDIREWLTSPAHQGVAASVTVVLLIITWISWYDHRRAAWKQAFKLLKSVKRVKPHDLNNEFEVCKPGEIAPTDKRPFYEGYVPRRFQPYHPQDAPKSNRPQNDAQLLEAIRQQQHVLLVGTPTQGKTRTAYELIKQLKGYTVVVPHSERSTPTEALRLLKNRRVVLFLDDLNYIKSTTVLDVVHFVDEVTRHARSVVMVATCRNGSELLEVTELTSHRVKQLYERFSWVLTLEDSTADEKRQVAQQSGLDLTTAEAEASPTMGWVVMEEAYKKMYDRFRRLSIAEQETLWTLQLLSAAEVLPLTQDRVQQVRTHVFEVDPKAHLSEVLRTLTDEDFLRKPATNDPVQARDAYVSLDTEKMVVPYMEGRVPKDDFKKLGEVLIQTKDEEGLELLGITLSVQYVDHAQALTYFKEAHRLNPTHARLLFNMGIAFDELGKYEEAIARYQKAVKYKEDYHEAWYNMGNAFNKLGEYDEAIARYQKAVKYKEDKHEAWYNMGIAFAELGKYDEAIACYQKAVKCKEDYHEAWYNMGIAFAELGKYDEAIARYQKAVKYKEDSYKVWNNIGVAFRKLGEYEEAIENYQEAVKHKENYYEAWYNKGLAFRELGKHDEAIACYQKAVKYKEDDHEAWNNMGIAFRELGKYDEAIARYQKAVKYKEDKHEAWYNMGIAFAELGKYDEAIARYQKAVKYKEDKHEAWNNMGLAFYELGKYKEAIENYQEAVKHKEDSYKVWNNIGVAFRKLGEYEEAIENYQEAVKHKENYYEAWYNKGLAFRELGKHDEAIACYQKAVKYKEDDHEAWYNMGIAFHALGKHEEALRCYQEAVKYKPDYHKAWNNMGLAFYELGQYEEAIEAIRRSVETGPDIPASWIFLGMLLAQSLEPVEAQEWLCKAWQAKSSLTKEQTDAVASALEKLGVDPATCGGEG